MRDSTAVLAAFAQTHLRILDEVDREGRIRARLDPSWLECIETAPRVSWVPLEAHAQLTECADHVLGAAHARELCTRFVRSSFEQPFMRPLVAGALALCRGSFAALASWVPRSWPALYRNVGQLTWERIEEDRGRLVLAEAAPRLLASRPYVEGLGGGFAALFDVAGHSGSTEARVEGNAVVVTLRWDESSASKRDRAS